MNPGEKIILKTVYTTLQVIVGGQTFEETVEVGTVMQARPGPRVDGPEYIALMAKGDPTHRWNAPLDDYDPDTVDDDPANESRWEPV